MDLKSSAGALPVTRREFVTGSLSVLGGSVLLPEAVFAGNDSVSREDLTVQQVIDIILKEIPGGAIQQTVDTLKSGSGEQKVTGIVLTMFATVDVIRQAIASKANFIIVHEPTFYNHLDETGWLEGDKVYAFKGSLLREHDIAVWRFHDYWHRHNPDGIRMGVLTALGWEKYYDENDPAVITLPSNSLGDIIDHVKAKLGIKNLRVIGARTEVCRRILLMPGASGGRSHIRSLQSTQPDLLICGEVAEWETSEYIRDARAMGAKHSLIVLGHAQSEEPGMQWLVQWLQPKITGIKVTHIPANNPFTFA